MARGIWLLESTICDFLGKWLESLSFVRDFCLDLLYAAAFGVLSSLAAVAKHIPSQCEKSSTSRGIHFILISLASVTLQDPR
jgi:hypothetical protein